jgi:hypothetical protein
MSDGELRKQFRAHLPAVHWSSIESGLTEPGVPDLNGCYDGVDFWVENKKTKAWAVQVQPVQIGWHLRHAKEGGRTFFAIRRMAKVGPRKVAADDLYIVYGRHVRRLSEEGLQRCPIIASFSGGPARWNWPIIVSIFTGAWDGEVGG